MDFENDVSLEKLLVRIIFNAFTLYCTSKVRYEKIKKIICIFNQYFLFSLHKRIQLLKGTFRAHSVWFISQIVTGSRLECTNHDIFYRIGYLVTCLLLELETAKMTSRTIFGRAALHEKSYAKRPITTTGPWNSAWKQLEGVAINGNWKERSTCKWRASTCFFASTQLSHATFSNR